MSNKVLIPAGVCVDLWTTDRDGKLVEAHEWLERDLIVEVKRVWGETEAENQARFSINGWHASCWWGETIDVIDQADEPCSEFTASEQAWLEEEMASVTPHDQRWQDDLYAEVERHRERHEDDGAGVEPRLDRYVQQARGDDYLSEGHDAHDMPF